MPEAKLRHGDNDYHPQRVVCVTVLPSYDQADYRLDAAVEAKVVKLLTGLGPNCRVSKFQWLVATAEACGAITQDLGHEGLENVLVFSALIGTDWKFWCKPECKADEWEFDGVAVFLQSRRAGALPLPRFLELTRSRAGDERIHLQLMESLERWYALGRDGPKLQGQVAPPPRGRSGEAKQTMKRELTANGYIQFLRRGSFLLGV